MFSGVSRSQRTKPPSSTSTWPVRTSRQTLAEPRGQGIVCLSSGQDRLAVKPQRQPSKPLKARRRALGRETTFGIFSLKLKKCGRIDPANHHYSDNHSLHPPGLPHRLPHFGSRASRPPNFSFLTHSNPVRVVANVNVVRRPEPIQGSCGRLQHQPFDCLSGNTLPFFAHALRTHSNQLTIPCRLVSEIGMETETLIIINYYFTSYPSVRGINNFIKPVALVIGLLLPPFLVWGI